MYSTRRVARQLIPVRNRSMRWAFKGFPGCLLCPIGLPLIKGPLYLTSCPFEPFMRALHFLTTVLLIFVSVHLSASNVLVDFQVAQPPPVPKDTKQCTIEILQ